ncbi:MAG: hypothetical protein ACK5ZG_10900 [Phycisphaerae bacterium]|jgi:hypothetical protein
MQNRTTRALFASAVFAAALFIAGCEDQLTLANYDKIQTGQQQHEVEQFLGGPGERDETSGVSISAGGIASGSSSNSQSTYIWKSKGKEVAVIFAGGKVVTKSQRGLR